MKKIATNLILALFLCYLHPCIGQETDLILAKADSLIEQFKQSEEADRGNMLVNVISGIYQVDVEEAKSFLDRISQYAENSQDTMVMITVFASTAEYHWRKSQYEKAVDFAMLSIELAASNDRFKSEMAKGYQMAGTIHLYLFNKEEALDYYKKATTIYLEQEKLTSVASVYLNTGVIYMDAAKSEGKPELLDSARLYCEKVLELEGHARDYTLFNAHGNLISIYISQKEWEKAESISKKWRELEEQNPSLQSKAMTYGMLGELYLNTGRIKQAKAMLDEGLQIARQIESKYEIFEYYRILSLYHKEQNEYKQALDYFEEYVTLKDSIYNREKVDRINELEEKYESKEREAEIAKLSSENKIQKLQAQQDAQTRTILILVAGALVIIALLLYSRFRNKAKTNMLLNAKNDELGKLNSTKDRLFSIISHDLKSPLSSFHTITKSLTDNWDQLEKEQLKSFIESLRDSSANVRDMMDNLLKWALTQTDQLGFQKEAVAIPEVLERVEDQLLSVSQVKNIMIDKTLDASGRVIGDSQFVEIVIRNILSNALKFSEVGSKISIALRTEGTRQMVAISDQGVGMEQAQIEQLIKGEIVAGDIQNSTEKGTGLGLVLSKELMDKMGAEMQVASEKDKGTTFKLIFDQAA